MGDGEGAGGVVAIHADETVGGGDDTVAVGVVSGLRLGLLGRLGFWGRFTFVATILLV